MDWITSRLLEVDIGACWGTLIQRWSVSEPKLHPRDCTCTLCGLRSDPEKDNFHEFLYYGDYSCGSPAGQGVHAVAKHLGCLLCHPGQMHFVRFYKAVHGDGEDITRKTSAGSGTIPDIGGSTPACAGSGCCPGVGLFRLIHSRQIEAGRTHLGGSFGSTGAGNVTVWLSIKHAILDIRRVG